MSAGLKSYNIHVSVDDSARASFVWVCNPGEEATWSRLFAPGARFAHTGYVWLVVNLSMYTDFLGTRFDIEATETSHAL